MENITFCEDALDSRIAELEAELRQLQSEKRPSFNSPLRQLFDSNLIAMCRASVDGALLDVNKAFEDLTGYTKSELLELGWQALTPPEWLEQDAESVNQLRQYGRAASFEKEYIRKDGTRVSILVVATAADAAAGHDVMAFILNLDEIKEGELKIKEREEQYRFLVDTIPQIVWIADSNRNIEYINNRFTDYTGLQDTDGLQQAWIEAIHPEDLPRVFALSQVTNETGADFELDVRHRHRDGTYHWSLCRSIPMKAPDGSIHKWVGTATDITEQKRAEQELRDRETHFRVLADGIPQIVWTANNDGVIDFFNHRWLEYTGLTIDQSLNNGWHLLIHPADLQQYIERWDDALKSGETHEFEFRLKRAVGFPRNGNGYRWHLCRAVPLRSSSGRIVKWFGTWTEIHDQRES